MIDYEKRRVAIRRRALRIHNGEARQDIRVLCPMNAGGWFCQWVAGHYGGCVLGRSQAQRDLRP